MGGGVCVCGGGGGGGALCIVDLHSVDTPWDKMLMGLHVTSVVILVYL